MKKEYPSDYRVYWLEVLFISDNFRWRPQYKAGITEYKLPPRFYEAYKTANDLSPNSMLDQNKIDAYNNFNYIIEHYFDDIMENAKEKRNNTKFDFKSFVPGIVCFFIVAIFFIVMYIVMN